MKSESQGVMVSTITLTLPVINTQEQLALTNGKSSVIVNVSPAPTSSLGDEWQNPFCKTSTRFAILCICRTTVKTLDKAIQ